MERHDRFFTGLLLTLGVLLTLGPGTFSCTRIPSESLPTPPPEEPDPQDLSQASLEKLGALAYTAWSSEKSDGTQSGVVTHLRDKASPGYNFLSGFARVDLLDMDGTVVHSWTDTERQGRVLTGTLLKDGSLLTTVSLRRLVRLAWDSTPLWSVSAPAHHEVAPVGDGTYLVPVESPPVHHNGQKWKFDDIVKVSADGKILDRWSSYDHNKSLLRFHAPPDRSKIPSERNSKGRSRVPDYYHLNSIEVIPENASGARDPRFRQGNILIGSKHANLAAILDQDTLQPVWGWGPGELDYPHMPRMLANGNILIFDNGFERRYSRLVEVDPIRNVIVWEYRGTPEKDFFSHWGGSAQRLPNGNTLIGESSRGRVFEITPLGEVVWDYYHPQFDQGKRGTIYRMERLPTDQVAPLLARLKTSPVP